MSRSSSNLAVPARSGAEGIGESGMLGVAAAIANAIEDAVGNSGMNLPRRALADIADGRPFFEKGHRSRQPYRKPRSHRARRSRPNALIGAIPTPSVLAEVK
jgi:hypothetical protein